MGEFLSAAVNSIGFSWIASPAQTELEIIVLDWLATAMGLPEAFSHRLSGLLLHTFPVLPYLIAFIFSSILVKVGLGGE